MGFFDALLAGAATGIGKGMIDQADYNDKLAAQQELLKEKHLNALQLQTQRADDRLFQAQTLAALKGSGGGGGGGDPIMGMIRSAKTPEEQQQVLGYIRALGGDDAAANIEQNVFGRVQTRERKYDTVDALGDGTAGPTSVTERVEYDRIKGQQALNRVYALIANKGDTKGNAQGEAQYFTNDMRVAGMEEALSKGKPLDQASEYASKVADPATYNKDLTNAERVRASERNADKRTTATNDAADLRHKAGQIRDLEKQVIELIKITGDKTRYGKDAMKEAQDMLPLKRAELAALKGGDKPAAATGQPTGWSASGNTAPNVQNSLARFSQLNKPQQAR